MIPSEGEIVYTSDPALPLECIVDRVHQGKNIGYAVLIETGESRCKIPLTARFDDIYTDKAEALRKRIDKAYDLSAHFRGIAGGLESDLYELEEIAGAEKE